MTESFVESTSAKEFCIGRGISLWALSNIERPIAGTRASMSLNTNGSFEPCDFGYSRNSTFFMAAPLFVKFIRILSFSRETIFSGIFSSGANGDCFCAWTAGVDFSCGAESFADFRHGDRPFVIFGSGARKCADVLPDGCRRIEIRKVSEEEREIVCDA